MSILNEHIDLITTAFDQFSADLIVFSQQLANSTRPIFLGNPPAPFQTAKHQAIDLYSNIWHQDNGDGRKTKSYYGLVGCDDTLINSAHQLNASKANLKQAVSILKQKGLAELNQTLHQRSAIINEALNKQGLGRLHLKQCYRTLPIVESCPDRVRFSWYTSGRSIKKITVKEAIDKLLKMGSDKPHIALQLDKLQRLNSYTPLAQIQSQAPLIRANFAWKTENDQWKRQARNCPLPILIPLAANQNLPECNRLPDKAPTERQRALRADNLIDPEPFIPSLRIHLYCG
ncbi:DNA replication terminus site-binding protein [Neptunomonas phycophila]|uniref:DNA replication terminus site-binding protein n=1 Tax=Neptunomonas phycophila TaxID=1572645 RepID=UPI0037358D8A